jgi:hypothetical protein
MESQRYGLDYLAFDPAMCADHDCVCHTVKDERVVTPFPNLPNLDMGNAWCCGRCSRGRTCFY